MMSSNLGELTNLIDECRSKGELSNGQIKLGLTSIAQILMSHLDLQPQINETKDIIYNKTQALGAQIQRLNSRINDVSELNQKKINEMAEEIKKLHQAIETKYKETNTKLDNKMKEVVSMDQLREAQKTKAEEINQLRKQLRQDIETKYKEINTKLDNEMKEVREAVGKTKADLNLFAQIADTVYVKKYQELTAARIMRIILRMEDKKQKQPIKANEWVNPNCSIFYSYLHFDNETITNNRGGWVRIFSVRELNKIDHFYIHIIKVNEQIQVGVRSLQPNQKYIYYTNNKQFWNDTKYKSNMGKGFNEGGTVEVIVDLEKGIIMWRVGQQIRHLQKCDELKQSNIKWVPFVGLKDEGDKIGIAH